MFTKIDDTFIRLNFEDGILVTVNGPNLYYYVELYEYEKNSNVAKFLEGHQIHSVPHSDAPFWAKFKFDAQFYMDFEIRVYRLDFDEGMQLIYTHRYNDRGKFVKFDVQTKNKEEAELWVERIHHYVNYHKCKPVIKTVFTDFNHRNKNFFITDGIEFYKTYKIGRYPKTSQDFKTKDPRKKGLLWFGHWKTFWSYEHPRKWTNLNSKEIVDDILGL